MAVRIGRVGRRLGDMARKRKVLVGVGAVLVRGVAAFCFGAGMIVGSGLLGCSPSNGIPRGDWVVPEGSGEAIEIRAVATEGERIRTRKQLTVTEIIPGGGQATSSIDESYVQTTLSVDRLGSPVQVVRKWERFETKVERPGMEPSMVTGALEGCEVELTQRIASVSPRLVSGKADAGQLSGMLIQSFDIGLLPSTPVKVGQGWVVDSLRGGDFSAVFAALGLQAQRNEQRCRLVAVERDAESGAALRARIGVDWLVSGTGAGAESKRNQPMVYRLSGELVFDVAARMVVRVELAGGKQSPTGTVARQIALTIERTPVVGWYE